MRGTDLVSPHPIFVFDGTCVMCSTGASFIMRHDPAGKVRFLSAQSSLGRAVYDHFGLPIDASYLLITPGGTFARTTGFFRLADILGGWFRLGKVFWLIPRPVRDRVYGWVANNRYNLFGKSEQCALLSADQRERLVAEDPALRAQLAAAARAGIRELRGADAHEDAA
jgi:predicted DCC family thiol-disulfide oxidoreductase YuxK